MPSAEGGAGLAPEVLARLAALADSVAADPHPAKCLAKALDTLESGKNPALAAALYDRLAYRVEIKDFWVLLRVAKAYLALGPSRCDAGFFVALAASRLGEANWTLWHAYRAMFDALTQAGQTEAALALWRHWLERVPQKPLADRWEIGPLFRAAGQTLESDARPVCAAGARTDHPVVPAELRPPWVCETVDDVKPDGLLALGTGRWERPAISVAELPGAQVEIFDDSVIVLDRDGVLHPDLCVASYPQAVHAWLAGREAAGQAPAEHVADDAVLIADYCHPPNLCHFLYDQFSRLWLYGRAGVDIARALVIAADPSVPFRAAPLRKAGVTRTLGTNQHARVRVKRLFVSSNCRDVRHFGHWGAPWVNSFVQEALGGRGTRGWRRIYLSRNDAPGRRVVNEAEVMAVLEPYGFELMTPGRMSYDAQTAAFKQASHIVAPHGAALAHMMLMPPDAHLLEIFHPLYTENAFALQVAALGIGYTAMVARDGETDAPQYNDPAVAGERRHYISRHIYVDVARLARYLPRLLQDAA